MRASPSRHRASVSGLARDETNGSMSCVNASSPVLAVTAGGIEALNSGSTSATAGRSCMPRRLTFTPCSGERITALRVTSVPVPAVVGMAMHGTEDFVSASPRPMTSR